MTTSNPKKMEAWIRKVTKRMADESEEEWSRELNEAEEILNMPNEA